ncbi:hypothetical protein IJG44_05985 [bacterium]|nr:hypothetical protein [bacterium]
MNDLKNKSRHYIQVLKKSECCAALVVISAAADPKDFRDPNDLKDLNERRQQKKQKNNPIKSVSYAKR